LTLSCEPARGLAAKGEVERVEESAASGLDLLDLSVVEVGAGVVGGEAGVWREDGRVGVTGAEAFDLDLTAIGGGEGEGFVDLTLDAGAVLVGVRSADGGVELGEVGWIGAEVCGWREGKDGVLNLYGVKDDAVVELDDGWEVAAGAVVEDAAAGAEDGFAVAGSVGERDTRAEVVVVGEEGLPVVTKA